MLVSGQVFALALKDLLSSGSGSELRPLLQRPIGISQSDEGGEYDVYRGEYQWWRHPAVGGANPQSTLILFSTGYSVTSGQLTRDSTPGMTSSVQLKVVKVDFRNTLVLVNHDDHQFINEFFMESTFCFLRSAGRRSKRPPHCWDGKSSRLVPLECGGGGPPS